MIKNNFRPRYIVLYLIMKGVRNCHLNLQCVINTITNMNDTGNMLVILLLILMTDTDNGNDNGANNNCTTILIVETGQLVLDLLSVALQRS